jgi:sugar phosphate isomerase/epimerase
MVKNLINNIIFSKILYIWIKNLKMKRRKFMKYTSAAMIMMPVASQGLFPFAGAAGRVRLGGPVYGNMKSAGSWVEAHKKAGFRAAYCPLPTGSEDTLVNEYAKVAEQNDLVIAEVGAWSNPISPDRETSAKAMEKCIASLHLADRIGARCCVNISGSRNPVHWAGPHPENLTKDTFDLIVESTRKIIDFVKPSRTFYTLEAMPWSYPDSADSYLQLIKAINRKEFGVHFDPVNWVISPQVFYNNGEMIRDAFRKLGPYIKSCHAKDIVIREDVYLPQFDEVRPGLGKLDYSVFLTELAGAGDIPLMMEHLDSGEAYAEAASFIKSKGKQLDIEI